MPDVPPLHEQEAQGQFLEAVEKLVDGVVEDIRGGHLTKENVQAHAAGAVRVAQYRTDPALAADVLKYGIDAIPDKDAATIFRISMQSLASNVFEYLVLSTLDRRPEVMKLFEKPKRSSNMAKAKKTVDPKKTNTAKPEVVKTAAKPQEKKPLGKSQRPAAPLKGTKKDIEFSKAVAKIVPKALPAGHVMTAKKLKTITDKKGFSTFLLKYPLDWLLTDGTQPKKEIEADIMRKVALDGHYADETTYEIHSSKKQEITLLVKTKIKPHQDPPPPVAATPEPPFTPADPVISPSDMLNSPTPPKVDPGPVQDTASHTTAGPKSEVAYINATPPSGEAPTDVPVKALIGEEDEDGGVSKKNNRAFDCSPWLAQASDVDITELARDGYSGAMADKIVLFCESVEGDTYGRMSEFKEEYDNEWVAAVDEDQFVDWVSKFRPHLMEVLAEIKDEQEEGDDENEYKHDKSGLVPAGKA